MSTNRRIGAGALAVLAFGLAGCEAVTVPDIVEPFDAEAAIADYEAMDAALASDDWAGFRALGDRTPFGSSPAAIDAMASLGTASAMDSRGFAMELGRRLTNAWQATSGSGDAALGPIISGWNRGTTFVYDPASDDYQPDLTLEGAPETGVRFIIYEVDEAGVPIVDQEAGYADLIDEGDGSVEDIVLRLNVVYHGETVLDYRATLDHDATSGALTLAGFLQGDGVRLDFDLGVDAQAVGDVTELEIHFDFGVAARGFAISGLVSGLEEGEDGAGSVEIEIQHRQESLRVAMTGSDGILDGTFYVNNEVFATVTGPEDDLIFADPTGEPLTLREWAVLRRVVDVVEDVFDFLEDLVDPLDEILFLAIIL